MTVQPADRLSLAAEFPTRAQAQAVLSAIGSGERTFGNVARAAGGDALARLWLCHPRWQQLVEWRGRCDGVRLVDSTRLDRIKEGPERRRRPGRKTAIH